MSEPFLAEVRIVGFNFAPRGWAFCDGQILPINQNQSLYSLLGTTYGGDGRTTFALPDIRSRTPIHVGTTANDEHRLGAKGGEETHTLSISEMPNHDHTLQASSTTGNQILAENHVFAKSLSNVYEDPSSLVNMRAEAVTHVGGSQAHNNMQPYITLNFCIALQGLFPSRN